LLGAEKKGIKARKRVKERGECGKEEKGEE
jgi:hypothetical protein